MTMAYKGIMGRDTGMSMPIGITCVAVAAAYSAAGMGRPSAGIGRVISGEIGRSLCFIPPAAEPHSADRVSYLRDRGRLGSSLMMSALGHYRTLKSG
jgi:hypothetical protein